MEENNAKGGVGALVGIIIVIVVLVAGAFYFYNQRMEKQRQLEDQTPIQLSESDEISDIEKDLSNVDFSDIEIGVDK
jgi:ABC-type transporter Mla subunit MlaD